jgi:hypothetical protein
MQKAVKELLNQYTCDWPYKLDIQIPHERFETHIKLRVDLNNKDPSKRFSLHLKAMAREPKSEIETKSEVESETEEENNFSNGKVIHGYISGNEGDSTW